jgi:hypothetical protein
MNRPHDDQAYDADPDLPDDEQPTEHSIEGKHLVTPLLMLPDIQFFTPGRDAAGTTERLFIRICPRDRDWLASFTNDKRFPFKGMNHLVRWCIAQGLRKLDRIRPTPTLSTQVAALQSILYEEQIAADFALVMSQTEMRISEYIKAGAKGEAARVIQAMRQQIELMPDGYWKGRYRTEIHTRWGDLLAAPGMAFGFDDHITTTEDDHVSNDDD